MLVGREDELDLLNSNYRSKKSSIIAIYGRRRIGKSFLVKKYALNKAFWSFEALENEATNRQIDHFVAQLQQQTADEFLTQMKFTNWTQVFRYVTEKLKKEKKKTVIFFDEFQWMAANQSGLVSLVKYFWDNHWKELKIQLILCGSIASFMVDKVIKSKALYGRIDLEMPIIELKPFEIQSFFKNKRSLHEILEYMLLLGGVPKYFELIDIQNSFEINIQKLAFDHRGYFFNDYEKIFYSQFREHIVYEKIVRFISEKPKDLKSISQHLGMKSSGGIKRYLRNLAAARFIKEYRPIQKINTNIVKYKLYDEYLSFYFKYIKPHHKLILGGNQKNIFQSSVQPKWKPWLGFAFENFCFKYNAAICAALKIQHLVDDVGPFFERQDTGGFQIDLLIKRTDKTWTLCECRYREARIDTSVVREVQNKVDLLRLPQGISLEKVLITVNGAEPSLEKLEFFNHILKIEDLFVKY